MKRKYFCFIKNYEITYRNVKEKVIIPKDQPIPVERLFDEWEYCMTFYDLRLSPSYSLGYFKDTITKDEEVCLYKLVAENAKNFYWSAQKGDLIGVNDSHKRIMDMWKTIHEQEQVIEGLKKAIQYK